MSGPSYTGVDPAESVGVLGPIVTVDAAGAWMQLPDPDSDILLEQAVIAGNAAAASFLGWDPRSMETIETVDSIGGNSIIVSRKKITAVNSVQVVIPGCAPVVLNPTFITFDARVAVIRYVPRLPRGSQILRVDYVAGYATLPSDLVQGILWTIKAHYDASGVDQNATGESFSGVLSQTFHAAGAGYVPPAAQSVFSRYCRDM